jgi:protein-disulfide isomerase
MSLTFALQSRAEENNNDHNHDHSHSSEEVDKDSEEYKEAVKQRVKAYEEYMDKIDEFDNSEDFQSQLLNQNLPMDINVGNADAPIKIVEYASLSCSHCKQFHEDVYYELKKDFIDSGKVFFKFRHYPLNGPALKAALVTDCAKESNKTALLGALFKGQSQWAYSKNESALKDRLKTISKIGGMTTPEFLECYGNEEKQDQLIELMKQASEGLKVTSTPTIFINGVRYVGSRDYEYFKKVMDETLDKTQTNSAE